jgi:hypothetical protein
MQRLSATYADDNVQHPNTLVLEYDLVVVGRCGWRIE